MPIVSNHAVTAVDIAKSVFEVAVSIQPGRVSERRTLSRSKFLVFFATRPAATVVMECSSPVRFRGFGAGCPAAA